MKNSFWFTYILLVIAQVLLSNYAHFSPFVIVTILPAMVFCIPTKHDTVVAMLVAFVTGLAVDYLAEGTIGINALALVPVAFLRRPLIGLMFGKEPFELKENINVKKFGFARTSLAVLIVSAIFLLIYILVDCAGTRPFWFIMLTLACSLVVTYLLSMVVVNFLTHEDRR